MARKRKTHCEDPRTVVARTFCGIDQSRSRPELDVIGYRERGLVTGVTCESCRRLLSDYALKEYMEN